MSAFVDGVIIGLGNLSFSFIPFGIIEPQRFLIPFLYCLNECPERYPLITISTLIGVHFLPTVTFGSGESIYQLGIIFFEYLSI